MPDQSTSTFSPWFESFRDTIEYCRGLGKELEQVIRDGLSTNDTGQRMLNLLEKKRAELHQLRTEVNSLTERVKSLKDNIVMLRTEFAAQG